MNADISFIREGLPLNGLQRLSLTMKLALPAMLAQLSSIAMQYIDAAMVGRLGADDSAAIGLVATSLWLFWGICSAMTSGYAVQAAHLTGARDFEGAKAVFRQGISATLLFSLATALIGSAISWKLPVWLGGDEAINGKASLYFVIFVAALPLLSLNYLAGGMLRCVGNMKIPSLFSGLMCVFDCIFNYFLIFPTHHFLIFGHSVTLPGANLGVAGAALGTVAAETLCAAATMFYACVRQPEISILRTSGSFRLTRAVTKKAASISAPMTLEHAVICGAQIAITIIVAPLGVVAIAANGFAVTAESVCYMPGYGMADAATTVTGQSHGANRPKLVRQFGYMSVGLGMILMSVMGIAMYLFSSEIMGWITPVESIKSLGAECLRIEAWAEPMFAASIVAYGVFVGVGQTKLPAAMNFGSIWLVRVPLAWWLARVSGLKGVWLAMCIELSFRGTIFLCRLFFTKWHSPTSSTQPFTTHN